MFGKIINMYDNVQIYQTDGNSLYAVVYEVQQGFIRIKVTISGQAVLASLPQDVKLEAELKPSYFESIEGKNGQYGRVLMFLHENISIVSLFQRTTNLSNSSNESISKSLNNHIERMEHEPVHANCRFSLMNLNEYVSILSAHQLVRHLGINENETQDLTNIVDNVSRQLMQTNTTAEASNGRFGQFGTYDRNFNICFNLLNVESQKLENLKTFFTTQHGITSFYTYYCGLIYQVNSGKLDVVQDENDEKLNNLSNDELYDVVLTQDEKPELNLRCFAGKSIRYLYLDSQRTQIIGLNKVNPTALKTLVLRHCQNIDLSKFTGLENLLVSTVPNFNFKQLLSLKNLKTLILKELLDETFTFKLLRPLKKLRNVQLSHVEMSNIDEINFPMPELEVLEIQLIDSLITINLEFATFNKLRRLSSDAAIIFTGFGTFPRLEDVQLLHSRQNTIPPLRSAALRSFTVNIPTAINPAMLLIKKSNTVKINQNNIEIHTYQANDSVCLNRIDGFDVYLQQMINSIKLVQRNVYEKNRRLTHGKNVEIQMMKLKAIL